MSSQKTLPLANDAAGNNQNYDIRRFFTSSKDQEKFSGLSQSPPNEPAPSAPIPIPLPTRKNSRTPGSLSPPSLGRQVNASPGRVQKLRDLRQDPDYRPYQRFPSRKFKRIPDQTVVLGSLTEVMKLQTLAPDTLYQFEGNSYRTDHFARPVETRGSLRLNNGGRRTGYDGAIGKKSGVPGDIGFHLGADRFGFVGGPLNVVPGNTCLNTGAYSALEDTMADHLSGVATNRPKSVEASFRAVYPDIPAESIRPTLFSVQYTVGGKDPHFHVFENGFDLKRPTPIPSPTIKPYEFRSLAAAKSPVIPDLVLQNMSPFHSNQNEPAENAERLA